MKITVLLLSIVPIAALAKDPFEGTWKGRLDSYKSTGAPDVFELKDGMFNCKSCAPPYSIKCDGTLQKTSVNAYRDQASFKITGPSSAEWSVQKAGKPMSSMSLSVSADGKTLTEKAMNYASSPPTSFTSTEKRIAAGAPGSHPIAGSWQDAGVSDVSANALVSVMTATPNGIKIEFNGTTVDAKFDGKEYPTIGDPGHTMVTMKRINDHEMEETDRNDGKVSSITHWKASSDGKTLTFVNEDKLHGTTTTLVEDRVK